MSLAELGVEELSCFLSRCCPPEVVERLADNCIDGLSLISLINDFDEFRFLIPLSGHRIKVKKLVEEAMHEATAGGYENSCSAVAPISSSLNSSPLNSSLNEECILTPSHDTSTPKEPEAVVVSKPKVLLPLYDEKRLPVPCPLPTFTPVVQQGIEKNKIIGHLRLRLLREAAMYCYGLCPRPTTREYETIAVTLCDMCPQLKDKTRDKCNWVGACKYISTKFRNMRRGSGIITTPKQKSTMSYCRLPKVPFSNMADVVCDDLAYKRNTDSLFEEMSRPNKNHNLIKQLLKLTFCQRRKEIMEYEKNATALVDYFFFFKTKQWVYEEFQLIIKSDLTVLKESWAKLSPKIAPNDLLAISEVDKKLKPTGPSSKQDGAFSMYDSDLQINFDEILATKCFPEPRLVILKSTTTIQGFIVAEGAVVFEVDDFTIFDGIVSLISSYYVLHINYPKSLRAFSFLLFLQEVLLGILDSNAKKTAKYTRFINSLDD